jgi:uncharacterized protein (TIGR03067 family)
VTKKLPPRPDLDHLRRQAKALLAALESGDPAAVTTIREHLPAAAGLPAAEIRAGRFRLADAQSAVARQTGFASWPRLARHVDQLRALEGTWSFARLEIDGQALPPEATSSSRLLIDGDRFRTESPEATYEGVFNIDVEAEPHGIDIGFVVGPEAGRSNFGIFRLDGDQLELCLDVNGRPRPADFGTWPGSGHALEILRRASRSRPESVTGGASSSTEGEDGRRKAAGTQGSGAKGADTKQRANAPQHDPSPKTDRRAFAYVPSPTLARLAGEWQAEKIVRDGMPLPKSMLATARRSAKANEIEIRVGGQLIIHALVRLDETTAPVHVDYYLLGAASEGSVQHGLFEWRGETACFCMAPPGQARPADFESPKGSGRTSSCWRPKA